MINKENYRMGGGFKENREVFMENARVLKGMGKNGGFWGCVVANRGFLGFIVGNWVFGGKMVVFLKNGVFVGFWSRNRGKVGKSREFNDFWKIGKNREK